MIKCLLFYFLVFVVFMLLRSYADFEIAVISAASYIIAILIKNDTERE